MATSKSYSARNDGPDPLKAYGETLTQLQEQRTEQLAVTLRYQQIEQQAVEREHARLTAKYGPDHPRVEALTARLGAGKALMDSTDHELTRSQTRQEPLPNGGWRVKGGVYEGKTQQPLPKLTVYLTNANHEPLKDLRYACTDEQGQYAITLDKEQLDQQREVFLTVADGEQMMLYRQEKPLNPVADTIELHDIYIGEDGCQSPFSTS